jgi:hypothetical protein
MEQQLFIVGGNRKTIHNRIKQNSRQEIKKEIMQKWRIESGGRTVEHRTIKTPFYLVFLSGQVQDPTQDPAADTNSRERQL